jgi:hypothetical protein
VTSAKKQPQIVISATRTPASSPIASSARVITAEGHLDNFVGVHAVMNPHFSGKMDAPNLRIELGYGDEKSLPGAHEVLKTLSPDYVVVVVDVTGALIHCDLVIEKCASPEMQFFVEAAFGKTGGHRRMA